MKTHMTRREFLYRAAAAGTSAMLAACGAPAPATAPEATPAGSAAAGAPAAGGGESGTLTAWGWEGTFEGLESQIPAFNKKYPNIKVDVKKFGYDDVHTNLLNAIVAGSGAPDLCAIDVLRLTQYVDGLVDLSAQAEQYKDKFVKPTISVGTYNGKIYGLATDSEPMGVFYRKDLWDQYGLKPESINTWGDLATVSSTAFDKSQGKVNLYAMGANETNLYEVLAVQQGFGGFYFSDDDSKVIVDDPKIVEAVTVIKQLWDAKHVQRNPKGGYSGDEMTALLKSSKVASQIVGPAWYPITLTQQMPELSGKWGLMRVPAIKQGGARVGYQYPTIWVQPRQSKLQVPGWEFARMGLIGDGAKALYDKTKVLPAYQPLLDDLKSKGDDYFGGQHIYQLWDDIAKDAPKIFWGKGFTEAQQIFGNHLQAILNGQQAVDAGLADAAKEMRAKLKKG